jgi:hypothetical protein
MTCAEPRVKRERGSLLSSAVSLEGTYAKYLRDRPASDYLVEALAYQLRDGVDALKEPSALRRISEIDEAQMRDIADRLTKWRWRKFKSFETAPRVKRLPVADEKGAGPPWAPDEIEAFVDIWRVSREKRI